MSDALPETETDLLCQLRANKMVTRLFKEAILIIMEFGNLKMFSLSP